MYSSKEYSHWLPKQQWRLLPLRKKWFDWVSDRIWGSTVFLRISEQIELPKMQPMDRCRVS
jgi:hypothetical protein